MLQCLGLGVHLFHFCLVKSEIGPVALKGTRRVLQVQGISFMCNSEGNGSQGESLKDRKDP